MGKMAEEWFAQADYDLDTAEFMFKGGRYFYAVFMAHLAVEKCLKGLYLKKLSKVPPKTHNLLFLVEEVAAQPSKDIQTFLRRLNDVSVPTRYPDDLKKITGDYTRDLVQNIILKAKETLAWIKEQR